MGLLVTVTVRLPAVQANVLYDIAITAPQTINIFFLILSPFF
jgi:hypothetical protein